MIAQSIHSATYKEQLNNLTVLGLLGSEAQVPQVFESSVTIQQGRTLVLSEPSFDYNIKLALVPSSLGIDINIISFLFSCVPQD